MKQVKQLKQIVKPVGRELKKNFQDIKSTTKMVISGNSSSYPPNVKNILDNYGDEIIKSLTLKRTPVDGLITGALSVFSLGKFGKRMAKNFDELFHLFLEIETQNGKKLLLEKNARINMDVNPKSRPNTEVKSVSNLQTGLTVNQMLETTKQKMGSQYFSYSPHRNNCQDFLLNVLQSNNIGDQSDYTFIKQDTEKLFKGLPILKKIAYATTELGEKLDIAYQGGSMADSEHICKYKVKELKAYAKSVGIDIKKKKKCDLIIAILRHETDVIVEEEEQVFTPKPKPKPTWSFEEDEEEEEQVFTPKPRSEESEATYEIATGYYSLEEQYPFIPQKIIRKIERNWNKNGKMIIYKKPAETEQKAKQEQKAGPGPKKLTDKMTFYEILDIDNKATLQDIKNSYRTKSIQYHPDKNEDKKEATKQTKLLNEAYEVLSNDVLRAIYDDMGIYGVRWYESVQYEDIKDNLLEPEYVLRTHNGERINYLTPDDLTRSLFNNDEANELVVQIGELYENFNKIRNEIELNTENKTKTKKDMIEDKMEAVDKFQQSLYPFVKLKNLLKNPRIRIIGMTQLTEEQCRTGMVGSETTKPSGAVDDEPAEPIFIPKAKAKAKAKPLPKAKSKKLSVKEELRRMQMEDINIGPDPAELDEEEQVFTPKPKPKKKKNVSFDESLIFTPKARPRKAKSKKLSVKEELRRMQMEDINIGPDPAGPDEEEQVFTSKPKPKKKKQKVIVEEPAAQSKKQIKTSIQYVTILNETKLRELLKKHPNPSMAKHYEEILINKSFDTSNENASYIAEKLKDDEIIKY
jgi:hypothetical protein